MGSQVREPSREREVLRGGAAALLAIPLCLSPVAGLVSAQTASQITPSSLQPQQRRLQGAVVFSGDPGLRAPEGAERLSVTIADVTVVGGFPELSDAERALEDRLVGAPIPVSTIFQAAQDLEATYADAGYVLARVVLPAQTLRDGGSLRLVVVDGFIEEMDSSGVPARIRPRIEAVTAPLVGQRGLGLKDIERRLLLAGDTPGTALTSALSTGTEPGGTILRFGAEYRSLTGFVGFDNTLSEQLGDWALSFGLEANSYFRLGEVIYLRASGHPAGDGPNNLGAVYGEYPQTRSLGAGFVVPIGTDGLTFNLEAVRSETTPELSGFQTASEFDRVSFRLSYPWIRSRSTDLYFGVILDLQGEDLDLLPEGGGELPVSEDQLTVLRVSADARRQFEEGGLLTAGIVASFGLDALGARTADDATETLPLSRQGADAVFSKLGVAASYARPVTEHLGFSLYGRAQTSFGDPLLRSEQIGIASFSELSTFDAGTIGGDSGWVVRGDLESPWVMDTPTLPFNLVTPYVFGAVGEVYLEEPSAIESERLRAASLGIGVEFVSVITPAFSDASLVVEYGRAFRDDGVSDDNRFTVVGSYRF